MSGTKKLVIVESPTKMRSISTYLGEDYDVRSSVGHIRDLIEPKNLPPELKSGSLGKFSVDVENGFEPYYVVSPDKKKTVSELKQALKNADELLLATDEDREGEAIAWHLLQELKPKVPVKRMVFHEITKDAILAALENTRELNTALVDAQETRRILDRLYGYELSPVLWRKVKPGLSAGRVQSAATRLVVERERERRAFVTATYWDATAELRASGGPFDARLVRVDAKRVASGRDFDDAGRLKGDVMVLQQAEVLELCADLERAAAKPRVTNVEQKPYTRRPAPPFTTSTLQQEAGRKLGLSARDAMRVAQSLYENGYITYMRTDSTALSTQAVEAARSQAVALYGPGCIPAEPRIYKSKSKNAQEAHEAIRPSGATFRTPKELEPTLRGSEFKLYELIWKRTIASQMADAKGQTVTAVVSIQGTRLAEFTATGTTITFPGFLSAHEEGRDADRHADSGSDVTLPPLSEGQELLLTAIVPKGHQTQPPPRYTEASLIKRLEELGIGRPSTFASTIATILDRGYVESRSGALVPSWVAFAVVRLLEDHFGELVEYDFTAEMESGLDRIAAGESNRVAWLSDFYFGVPEHPGLRGVVENLGDIDAREVNSIVVGDGITLRVGRYGPYLERTTGDSETPERVSVPPSLAPDQLTPELAKELIETPAVGDRELGVHPESGRVIVVKDGRFGPYVTEIVPEAEPATDKSAEPATDKSAEPATDKDAEPATDKEATTPAGPKGGKKTAPATGKKTAAPKPRTASLFKAMNPAEVDLETALKLLSLPRELGVDENDAAITAQNGPYGPYLKRGTETRSLPNEDAIFTVTLAEAVDAFSQPKYANRTASSALKEFEADPVSGKPIKLRNGRFGPYVTDGTTNATIPRGETPEDVTFERAIELLQARRDRGPAKPRGRATTRTVSRGKPTRGDKK